MEDCTSANVCFMGFCIHREYGNKNASGVLTSRRFTCCKVEFQRIDKRDREIKCPHAEAKIGCAARMVIVLAREKKKYKVIEFESSHNHDLHTAGCVHLMLSQRNVSNAQGIDASLTEAVGLSLKQSDELMSAQVGGKENLGCTKEDLKRYFCSRRQRNLRYGEAAAIMRYFEEQASMNPSFFHAVQLDCDELITNIFWADACMVMEYSYFGDVVIFGITYKTNKQCRPLGVFIGFNQYRQLVVFGAALLYDETIDSFNWLFTMFIEAMGDKHHRTIFTDQDAAMATAISIVFPQIFHGLCTFHIWKNFIKHLGYLCRKGLSLSDMFRNCMLHIEDEKEFLEIWQELVLVHELEINGWIKSIFAVRVKWARCYLMGTWTAGMHS